MPVIVIGRAQSLTNETALRPNLVQRIGSFASFRLPSTITLGLTIFWSPDMRTPVFASP